MKFFTRLFLGGGSGPVALSKQFSFCCLTFILFLPSLFFAKKITAQFIATPPVINGVIAANEYGTHTNTNNQNTTNNVVTYMTWDATNLYFATSGASVSEALVIYIDKDALTPINGGTNLNGSNIGFSYDNANFAFLQFRADIVIYAKNGYKEYRSANGLNGWGLAQISWGNYFDNGQYNNTGVQEFSIPWTELGGLSSSFNFFSYKVNGSGFVYNAQPTENLPTNSTIGLSARWERYFTVTTTLDGTATKPFSRNSYVFNGTVNNNSFGSISVWDFTMNTNALQIARVAGNWNIGGTLVVGQGNVFFGSSGSYGTSTVANVNIIGGGLNMDQTNQTLNVSGNVSIVSGASMILSETVSGDLAVGGNFANNGTFTANGRVSTFNGTGTQTISGLSTSNFGFLTINKSSANVILNAAASVTSTLTINGTTTFSLNGNNLSVGNLAGSSTNAIINNNHASTNVILIVTDGGNNTFAGILQNGGAATLGLTKQGATNSLTLSGLNTYTGTTTLSGAGKLFLTSNMNLGPLIMTATSNIDLGVGAAGFTVNFANSSSPAWTGTFTIFNWTPSAGKIINVAGFGLTPAQLAQTNIDNYGVGSKFVGIEVRPALLYVTNGGGGGSYTNTASWLLGDIPPAINDGTASIYVQPGDALTLVSGAAALNFLRVQVAGNLIMDNNIINVYANGDFRISGTVAMTAASVINMAAGISMIAQSATASFSSAGTLNFNGAFTITSFPPNVILLPNVRLTASVNFGDNSTIRSGSFLFMLPGGFISTNPPTYEVGSTLVYQTGGDYGRGLEWSATSGKGYPHHVTIATSNPFRLSNGSPTVARQMGGDLTIGINTRFTMEDISGLSATLTVLGNVNINGELRLGDAIGGDIKVGGNYTAAATSGANGTIFNNNRAVIFIGSGDQFVTKTGGGTIFFDFIVVNKSSGNVRMTTNTNAQIISQVNNDLTLRVLQLLNGGIDMNDGIITLVGNNVNSLNIFVDGGSTRRIFTSTGTGEFRITGTNDIGIAKLTVTAGFAGSNLLFDNNVLVTTNVGVNFGPAGISTINSILQIDPNGYIIVNSPNYGKSSTLIYNNGINGYKRNTEWNASTYGTAGTGFPNNIIVKGNTPLQLNSTDFPATFALGCSGNFTIEAGSSVTANALDNPFTAMAFPLSVGRDLTIAGTLTLSTNTAGILNVGGNWARTGTFVQNDRMVTFNGTNSGTITATGGQLFTRMTIDKSTNLNTIAVTDPVTISNELFLQRGAVTLNNEVIIKSDAIQTARIGQTTTPENISVAYNGSGKFVIQRYLPMDASSAARRWRLLAAAIKATNGAPTINTAWQEGVVSADRFTPSLTNPNPGFGTHITRTTVANGYDQGSTTNPSIYNYVAGAWAPLDNTNSTAITSSPGYMLFVRGDRSFLIAGTNVAASPTTLRVKGEINIGTVTVPLNASTHQVIGNPYASAISFNSVSFNGVNPGTTSGSTFYLWDPKFSGSKNVGGFVTFTSLGGGLYSVTANGSGYIDKSSTGIIESGAAFMVQGTGVGNFIFNESCKLASNSTVGIASRPTGGNDPLRKMDFFTSNLYSGTKIAAKLLDGVNVVGSTDFDNEINVSDAIKLAGFSGAEMLSLKRSGKKISIELRKKITHNDTLFYEMSSLPKGAYQFELIGKNIDPTVTGILVDSYAGKQEILNTNDTNRVVFDVVENALSASADRFMVVFKSSAKFNSINAYLKDEDVSVEWVLGSQINITRHEIQRSLDGGNSFVTIGDLPGGLNNFFTVKYSFTDLHPTPGNYLYRVKSVTGKGVEILSENAAIKIINSKPGTFIFSNPITTNIINIQMNKMPAAIYSMRLLNAAGQVIQTSTINHSGTNTQHTISIAQSTAKGTYQLQLSAKGKKTILLPVLIQ